MQIYVIPSCAFLVLSCGCVKIYEFLFIRFRRVWFMRVVVVKFQLLLEVQFIL